ncbi:hypothetical protein UO65_5465 [Actinokineospora spheciospongiae]|uniref:Uncharacterized protein n=1 Tax=Actinokineospora spheciospongiae TaxID=909613 RepID=W7IYY3_9PSEU|nr:hypothetical protein UO65_5465 [Actinokineospora spheciospongiae]
MATTGAGVAVVVGLLAALTPAQEVRRFSLGIALAVMMAVGITNLPNRG